MKEKFLQICRCLFGSEVGYVGTGCDQWYYTLYVAISIMFAWRNCPSIAPQYTAVLVVEYIGVCIYGYFTLVDYGLAYPILYLLFILTAAVVRFLLNWQLALITLVIGIIGAGIAPDEEGQSLLFQLSEDRIHRALISNATYFGLFAYAAIVLPVDVGTKVIIIIGAMLLHPLVDMMDGCCICYCELIAESVDTIIDYNDEHKDRKYQQTKTTNKEDTPQQ